MSITTITWSDELITHWDSVAKRLVVEKTTDRVVSIRSFDEIFSLGYDKSYLEIDIKCRPQPDNTVSYKVPHDNSKINLLLRLFKESLLTQMNVGEVS